MSDVLRRGDRTGNSPGIQAMPQPKGRRADARARFGARPCAEGRNLVLVAPFGGIR